MYIPVGLENSPYRGLCGPNLMAEARTTSDNAIVFLHFIFISYNIWFLFWRFFPSPFQAADTFLKDACGILGITKDSPLTVVTNTGCTALPALLSLKQVMMTRQVFGIWNGRDELPVIKIQPIFHGLTNIRFKKNVKSKIGKKNQITESLDINF